MGLAGERPFMDVLLSQVDSVDIIYVYIWAFDSAI